MRDGLAGLHDPDNGSLGFVIAVRRDSFVGFFILLFRFFRLDLVDFDADLGIGEILVYREQIAVVDLFASRGFR